MKKQPPADSMRHNLREDTTTKGVGMEQGPMNLSYRHWFFISLLILVNIVIFGCLLLAILGKVYLG